MKYFYFVFSMLAVSAQGAESVQSWFEEGKVKGNVKYYYIETQKDTSAGSHTSAHANAIGGQLNYSTGSWNGLQTGVTFMTTNGFALPNAVDTSILGRDNGARTGNAEAAKDAFAVLGEAFIKYSYKDLSLLYGRQVIKTPLVHAKEVRMLPSAVQGAFAEYALECGTTLGVSYLTHFKQRTSDTFTNIVSHALGGATKTKEITGSDEGEVVTLDAVYKDDKTELKAYDYYAQDFMNAFYLEAGFKNKLDSGWSYSAAAQYIHQMSVGNADDNLAQIGSVTGGKRISVNAAGLKTDMAYQESTLGLALTKVLGDSDRHDSLVLPWDGTPLYTNMITSNDLFQSNYGNALKADSIYIGGSAGVKLAYTQGYDFSGMKGFKTTLSYLNVDNDRFAHNQRDVNAVVSYVTGDFSLALKGMWVRYNTSASATGTITQDDKLTQYRVIANYKF